MVPSASWCAKRPCRSSTPIACHARRITRSPPARCSSSTTRRPARDTRSSFTPSGLSSHHRLHGNPLRGQGAGRAHHAQPARRRQRDRPDDGTRADAGRHPRQRRPWRARGAAHRRGADVLRRGRSQGVCGPRGRARRAPEGARRDAAPGHLAPGAHGRAVGGRRERRRRRRWHELRARRGPGARRRIGQVRNGLHPRRTEPRRRVDLLPAAHHRAAPRARAGDRQSRAERAGGVRMGSRHARARGRRACRRSRNTRAGPRLRGDAGVWRGEAAPTSKLRRVARDADGARGAGDRRASARPRRSRGHRRLHRQARAELRWQLMKRLILLACAALPALAAAQDKPGPTLLGAGLRSRPTFDGSAERTVDLIPMVRYFGKTWFARTTQDMLEGGARWNIGPGLDVGAQLAYEPGPRDHDPDASVGLHIEADRSIGIVPVNGLLRLRQHLNSDRGVELDARANVGVYRGHGFLAGLYAQATWASEKHFESYYDVHESGLLTTRLGAFGGYDLTPRWVLFASIEQRRLSDEAMKSPIVQRRSGAYAGASVAYRF